jgi:hypothetical protein
MKEIETEREREEGDRDKDTVKAITKSRHFLSVADFLHGIIKKLQ